MGEIRMTRDLFLWCMSVIYLFAFTSLYVQIPGLYYDTGILPARLVIKKEAQSFKDLFFNQPSLLRLVARIGVGVEAGLDLLALGGVVLAFVAMVCRSQRNTFVFAALWVFYLSLFQVGQTFMWFQWDILLLETGFLTILVAPFRLWRIIKGTHHQHDNITLWLIKWLLFRLMFASGVVKLTSMCPTWWGLTALNYHYETQCIPTPGAWYFHQLPEWFQKLSVVSTYMIEIFLPFLFFSPVRSQRLVAFFGQLLLQVLIILTGNYNFFNLLTITLCLSLVDDNFIRRFLGKPVLHDSDKPENFPLVGKFWRLIRLSLNLLIYGGLVFAMVTLFTLRIQTSPSFQITSKIAFSTESFNMALQKVVPVSMWLGGVSLSWEILKSLTKSIVKQKGTFSKLKNLVGCVVFGMAAVGMFAISLVDHTVIEEKSYNALWPMLHSWHDTAGRVTLTSSYGLFRTMTGVGGRPEVIMEGSDSVDHGWREYGFLYKPGNVSERLGFVAPHQPRLDWQMWFAALGSYQRNPWLLNLAYRILSGEKEVLELMGHNPYPDRPPTYLRATLYHYHYTSMDEKTPKFSKKNWWVRTKVGEYLPVITKQEPSFVSYLEQAGIIKDKKKYPDPPPNYLSQFLMLIRRLIGQPDGFYAVCALFVTGLVLTFLDPSVKLGESARR